MKRASRRRSKSKGSTPAEIHEQLASAQLGKPTIARDNHEANFGQRQPETAKNEVHPDDHDDEGT